MSRLLPLLFLLFACSRSDRDAEIQASYRSLHTWLDTWLEARRCLLGDAPDTLTGVTVGNLIGRDCSKLLHQLELQIPTDDVVVDRAWMRVIDHFVATSKSDSLKTNARGIDDTDAGARALGLAIGRWILPMHRGPALPSLPEPIGMFGGEASLDSVSGGFVYGSQIPPFESNALGVHVDRLGRLLAYTQELDYSRGLHPQADIRTPERTLVVRVDRSRPEEYAIDVTPKGGTTRTTRVPGALRFRKQDPKTGEIVMYVEAGQKTFIHRLKPGATTPSVTKAALETDFEFDETCIYGGEVWGLWGTRVVHLTTPEQCWSLSIDEISKTMKLDCRRDVALVLRHDPDVLERCSDEGCQPVFVAPTERDGVAALLDDGRWIYAADFEGMVALWIEGADAPQVYRLAGPRRELEAVAVDQGELLLVYGGEPRRHHWSVSVPNLPSIQSTNAGRQVRAQP
jgi:hypothetical protein